MKPRCGHESRHSTPRSPGRTRERRRARPRAGPRWTSWPPSPKGDLAPSAPEPRASVGAAASEPQPLLESPRPVARDLELRPRRVLESHDEATAEIGLDLGDPGQVDDRAPVDADELPWVQPLFEVAERAVDEVAAGRRHRDRPLPLGHEVGDLGGLHELRALLAEVDADAVGVDRRPRLLVVAREPLQHPPNAGAPPVSAPALEPLPPLLHAVPPDPPVGIDRSR